MLNDSDPDNKERTVSRLDLGISSLIEGNVEVKEVDVPIGEERSKVKGSGLDLGISELLADDPVTPSSVETRSGSPTIGRNHEDGSADKWKCFAPPSERTEIPAVISEPMPETEVAVSSVAYEGLVQSGRWEDISRDCEKRLADAGGARAIEPRLWWIFSQLRLGSLPASILHSRFTKAIESLASVERSSHILHLASTVGLELADALEEEGRTSEVDALRKKAAGWSQSALESDSESQTVSRPVSFAALEPGPEPASVPSASEGFSTAAAPRRRAESGRRRHPARKLRSVLPLLLSFLLGLSALVWLNFSRVRALAGPAPYVSLGVEGISSPEPIPPVSEPLKRFSDLTAIYYDVSSQSASPAESSPPAPQASTQPAPSPDGRGRKAAKERIDTSSPKETREIRRMAREPRREKAADIDFPPFVKGSRALEGRYSADDSRAKPTFSRSRVATVSERTSVYSLPAKTGRVIERLEPGDRVLAIKRHGRWLEIESSDGAGGYVPVEDIAGY